MNIKSKQFKIFTTAALSALFTATALFGFAPQVSADSPLNDVTAYCKKTAKKAVESCPRGAEQAYNKASYNCTKSNDKEKCIKTKAQKYIASAAKGNKTRADFDKNLKAVLAKVKGDADKVNPAALTPGSSASFFGGSKGKYQCGGNDTEIVTTKIDFGCMGPDEAPEDMGAITDLVFAFIRFLSAGVGLVVVASIIVAGIQYTTSEGKAEATVAAKSRVRNALIGLIIYIFGFAAIQFLVPGGLFD